MEEENCKEEEVIHDVEEGEISDSASVEEISEELFNTNKPAPPPLPSPTPPPPAVPAIITVNSNSNSSNVNNGGGSGARVWNMKDFYNNYQVSSRTSYSGLYNLAWAQAVNNKPLDEVFVMMEDSNSKGSNPNGNEESKVVIDVEDDGVKEEGELEEGEIDLDSDVMVTDDEGLNNGLLDMKKQFDSLDKELSNVGSTDAEKSFDGICSNLKNMVDSLMKLVEESSSSEKDGLVQLLLATIKKVNSVFSSVDERTKDQNRDRVSRLLAHIISLKPPLFSSQQLKELEVVMSSIDSLVDPVCKDNSDKKKQQRDGFKKADPRNIFFEHTKKESISLKKGETEPRATGSLDLTEKRYSVEYSNQGVVNPRLKGVAIPLLDLHKDHDADSLPSPTREHSEPLPFNKGFVMGQGSVKPEWPVPRRTLGRENSVMHPYETDAVKAVSSYQQKFSRSSLYTNNDLPSPTPSEESNTGDLEMSEEVSSSVIHNASSSASLGQQVVSSVNSSIIGQSAVSYTAGMAIAGQGFSKTGITSSASTNPNIMLKPSSAKSRDPRLRFNNPDSGARNLNQVLSVIENNVPKLDPIVITSSRKQNTVEKQVLDGPALKRQRNESTDSGYVYGQTVTAAGGWLEDRGTSGIPVSSSNLTPGSVFNGSKNVASVTSNLTARGNEKFQIVGQNTTLPVSSPTFNLSLSGPTSTSSLPPPATTLSVNSPFPLPLTSQIANLPMKDSTTTSSLHSLLKGRVNPTLLMDLIKMEQQRSFANNRNMAQATQAPDLNTLLGAVPSTNGALYNSSMLGHVPPAIAQTPQPVSVEESGKVRMKPRDPRRILHSNSTNKGGTAGSEQIKSNASLSSAMQGNLSIPRQDQLEKKLVTSSTTEAPDITRQFTSNLRNIADILSASQASTSSPVPSQIPSSHPVPSQIPSSHPVPSQIPSSHPVPSQVPSLHPVPSQIPSSHPVPSQIPSSQPVQGHQSGQETKDVVSESGNLRNPTVPASEEANTGPPRPLNANAWSDVEHLFEGFDDKQKAAIQSERARRLEEQKKMFSVRKLCLVLDIDHTLLNSAKFMEVEPVHEDMLSKKEEVDREQPYRHLFRFPHMAMWTKLRPGIWNFLEKASKLFELHLYTMGNKYYATEMAKVLDPSGDLFCGRVISRGDDGEPFDGTERVPKIKDLEGVLGMESAVVIMDDSIRVWPHNKLNLIVVERYIYFPCSRRQFGLPGPSLLEIDHDERPEDGTLAASLGVIERIHRNFFSHESLEDADVRNILASEQKKILAGCRIVFSRVFPVGEAKPHMHPMWQTAEQFGAVCTNQIDEHVTHVVANSLGTDKVNWALSMGKFVVYPGWVEASALLYRRANEQDFAVKQ